MSVKRLLKTVGSLLATTLLTSVGCGYVLVKDSGGYVKAWMPGTITMQVKLASSPTLSDGTSQSASVVAALNAWNAQLGVVQFSGSQVGPGDYENGNGINEIVMDSTIDGDAFGTNTLAVTVSYTSGNEQVESDIVFNTAHTWDSYRGDLQAPEDIRRVAIHELGHVLGLTHPDQYGQGVTAIMNSTASNVDELKSDDIAGGQQLYGSPGFVPANDNFASAAVITNPGSAYRTGANIGASSESGEPAHADETARRTVWWRWTAPSLGTVTLTTWNSNFDTVLAVYIGSSLSTLSQVASNDDESDSVVRTSLLNFTATAGTTYYFAVDGWDGYFGQIMLNLYFSAISPPSISWGPYNQYVYSGQSATFTVSAYGQSLSYQWQKDGVDLPGANQSTLTLNNVQLGDAGQYRVQVSNPGGAVTSSSATLNVTPSTAPSFTNVPTATTVNYGDYLSLFVSVSGAPSPTVQWRHNGVDIPGATSQWYSPGYATSAHAGVYTAVATNAAGSATTSPITVTVRPAVAPSFTAQPQSQTVVRGGYVSLNPQVSGSNPLRFQWYRNGVAIPYATSSYLSYTAELTHAGEYRLMAINDAGSVESATASVVVVPAPMPSFGNNTTTYFISATNTWLSLSGYLSTTLPITYQWFKDGVAIPGATSSSYYKSNATEADAGTYIVQASGEAGISTSAPFIVHWTSGGAASWLDAVQLGDIVYFLATSPGRVLRYDLAAEGWLPAVYLSETKVPTAFLPTNEGVFIAYNQELVRRTLQLGGEVAVTTATNTINVLFSYGDRVYFPDGDSVKSYQRNTLQAYTQSVTGSSGWNELVKRPVRPAIDEAAARAYTTRYNSYPSDVTWFGFTADGLISAGVEAPYHGDFQIGTRQYLVPSDSALIDNSGVVYNLDLTYRGSLGKSFDDLVVMDDGTLVALRNRLLTIHANESYVTRSSYTLPQAARVAFGRGGAIFAFGAAASAAGNPTVAKASLANFSAPTSPTPPSPVGSRFSVDHVFMDAAGVVHLTSRSVGAIIRWDPATRTFLDSLSLRSVPVAFDYAPALDRMVVSYADGMLGERFLADGPAERLFGSFSTGNSIRGLKVLDDQTLLHLGQSGSSAERRLVLDDLGQMSHLSDWSYFGPLVAWNSAKRRLYSSVYYNGTMQYQSVSEAGVIGTALSSTDTLLAPLRLNDDGTLLATGNGRILNADLQQLAITPDSMVDAVWVPDAFFSIRGSVNGTTLTKRARITYEEEKSTAMLGLPLFLGSADESTLVVVTMVGGHVAFYLYDRDLNLVEAVSNGGGPVNGIYYGSRTFPSSAGTGTNLTFTYEVANSGTKPWGANHFLLVRDANQVPVAEASLNGVEPGETITATFTMPVPATASYYNYTVGAVENGAGGGAFGTDQPLSFSAVSPTNEIYWNYQSYATLVDAESQVHVTYNVTNTGSKAWGADHHLLLRNTATGLLVASTSLGTTNPAAVRIGTFAFTAPQAGGLHRYQIEAVENLPGAQGLRFGTPQNIAVMVEAGPLNGITYNNTSFPEGAVPAGSLVEFTYNVSNSGTKDWGTNHFLVLRNGSGTPVADASLATTAIGASKSATLRLTAPATAGTYTYRLHAVQNGSGGGSFGNDVTLTLTVASGPANGITYHSSTFPTTEVAAGSLVQFTYYVTNSGTKDWGSNHYLLLRNGSRTPIADASLGTTLAGGSKTATLRLTAPMTAGTYTYYLRGVENGAGGGTFGPEITLTLVVTLAPVNGITFKTSTFPTGAVVAGSELEFTYNVTNSGTKAWGLNHYLLLRNGSRAPIADTSLSGTASAASKTATLRLVAPSTTGTYTYYLRAVDNGIGGGAFGDEITLTLNVSSDPVNGLTYNATTFPTTAVATGSQVQFTYNVTNSGTRDWGANHFLLVRNGSRSPVADASLNGTAAGGSKTVTLRITAPASAGTYTYYLRGVENGAGGGVFGREVTLTLIVTSDPVNGITYNTTTFPTAPVLPGSVVQFTYDVWNSGTKSWGSNHYLLMRNAAGAPVADAALATTPVGSDKLATLRLTAPSSPGTYLYSLRGVENGTGGGAFGEEITLALTVGTAPANAITYNTTNFPGELVAVNSRVNFTYNVTNSGTGAWGANHFLLLRNNAGVPVADAALATTAAGQDKAVALSFSAPATPGTHTYHLRAVQNGSGGGEFGEQITLTLNVAGPENAITFNSMTFPEGGVAAGSTVAFTCNVTNEGSRTWDSNHFLLLRNGGFSPVADARLSLTASGGSKSVNLQFTAPASDGTYTYYLQAIENGRSEFGPLVTLTLSVGNGIVYHTTTFPTTAVAPGSTVQFTYDVTNAGTKDWGANHFLLLRNGSGDPWADASLNGIAIGATTTATLRFTAPASAGTYTYYLRAVENGAGGGAFGREITLTLTVSEAMMSEALTGVAGLAFEPIPTLYFGEEPYPLQATGRGGDAVTYQVLSGPVTVQGNALVLNGAGTATIGAQSGVVSAEQSFEIRGGFEYWRVAKFTTEELADAAISGEKAAARADRLTNLEKYALGLDPKTDESARLPRRYRENRDWFLVYQRPIGLTDVAYVTESSLDGVTWTPVQAELLSAEQGIETWVCMQTSATETLQLRVRIARLVP